MSARRTFYWIGIALLLAATCLPYIWHGLVGYRLSGKVGDFSSAALWLLIFLAVFLQFTEYRGFRRWWPVLTGPVALFPAAVRILTVIIWKTRGFAP